MMNTTCYRLVVCEKPTVATVSYTHLRAHETDAGEDEEK